MATAKKAAKKRVTRNDPRYTCFSPTNDYCTVTASEYERARDHRDEERCEAIIDVRGWIMAAMDQHTGSEESTLYYLERPDA